MRTAVIIASNLCLWCLLSCHETNEVVEVQQPRISLTVSRLPRLGQGEGNYELWAKFVIFDRFDQTNAPQHDSTAVSLGKFNVTADGNGVVGLDGGPARFTIPADQDPQLMDIAFVSIQQADTGDDPGPILLAGRVSGDASVGVADLDVSHPAAFGSPFANVTGDFTIIAPTSPSDSNSGVWFVDRQGSSISAGLRNLPVLPEGWVYEGWVGNYVTPEPGPGFFSYFSTGRFLRADSADLDGAGPGRGPGAGFSFPGQDFINATGSGTPVRPDLRFYVFMVTIEPDPDNSPRPFPLILLSTPLPPAPLPQGQTLLMNNVSSSSLPQGRIRIVRSGY